MVFREGLLGMKRDMGSIWIFLETKRRLGNSITSFGIYSGSKGI